MDLYQFAGSVSFPEDRYEIMLVESGGGLGGPLESLFAGGVTEPGRVDLAYTKRYKGPGSFGDIRIASIKVLPRERFNIRDFRIDSAGDSLIIRDSDRNPVIMQVAGGGQ